ncbi:hypothetical protein ACJO2E_04715 [Marinobacter sp. M1N3S26]|uniref:hypothetical protein n=1 Tax=Marinobacter sp. M1N3S26 TaxID=3382299 RepID=UPI00387B8CA3
MEFMTQAQKLATALARQFGGCEEMHFTVQMRRGEDWITLDMYRNAEEPHRFYTTLDLDTGSHIQLDPSTTIH